MNVLIIAPHPDDESLGCGGTILKHIANGDKVYWLIVTAMTSSGGYTDNEIEKKSMIIETISNLYSFSKTIEFGLPTCKLDQYDFSRLVGMLAACFDEIQPEIIYVPNRTDIHTDHQVISAATWSAAKAFRRPFIKKILMYETLSETECALPVADHIFIPNVYVDITNYIDEKIDIISYYENEILSRPFPRSRENVKALAIFRGSSVNLMYAEAFMLVREIV